VQETPGSVDAPTWGEAVEGLRFRIWTDRPRYEEGEDIWLHVEFQNTGGEDVAIRVNHAAEQFPQQKMGPLYDLTRLFLSRQISEGSERSSTIELLPIASSKFRIDPDLRKLPAGRTCAEMCRLDSGFWDGAATVPGSVFGPGRYALRAVYSWPARTPPSKMQRRKLDELAAPLWQGTIMSNTVTFEVAGRALPARR
jgi:hypothetical protein